MTRSPRWLYANLAFAACAASPSVALDNHAPHRTGVLEGRVVDPETLEVIAFFPLAITPLGQAAGAATTDARGHYRVEVPAGAVVVGFDPDAVTARVRAGQVTRLDIAIGRAAAMVLGYNRLPTCPGSPLHARVEGHPAPQSEVDALARAYLAEFGGDYADGSLMAIELPGDRSLTAAALSTSRPGQFRLVTTATLHAWADVPHSEVFYTRFDAIDSDGRCALVTVIQDHMMPSTYSGIITPSGSTALFERRGAAWILLAEVHSWES